MQSVYAETVPNQDVWDVLRKDFRLNHEIYRPEVQKQIRWITSHPIYIQKLIKSEPYIYHIMTELKKRNMPGEVALMPMIESAFNPFARSPAGASGLWQIMPRTGREYGLRQNWWYDSRRAISPSTKAALNYLLYLNKYFHGNWTLTLAAYDAGEGSVARSLRKAKRNSRNVHFWSLRLPRETKFYIPKLYALAEVIQHPSKYKIKLPHIEHRPYFKEVNVGSQIDLDRAARLAGVSYQSLIRLNPEYNRFATAPGSSHKLLIPVHKVEKFTKSLASLPTEKRVTWFVYKVLAGDDLQSIAKKNNTSTKVLKDINKLKTASVNNQQFLLIPKSNLPKQSARNNNFSDMKRYKVIHIVSDNDTYQSLQTKYNVSADELVKWNERLSLTGRLLPGQSIVIWKVNTNYSEYVVKNGDSIGKIAENNNKKVNDIIVLNPGLDIDKIIPGQTIRLS